MKNKEIIIIIALIILLAGVLVYEFGFKECKEKVVVCYKLSPLNKHYRYYDVFCEDKTFNLTEEICIK